MKGLAAEMGLERSRVEYCGLKINFRQPVLPENVNYFKGMMTGGGEGSEGDVRCETLCDDQIDDVWCRSVSVADYHA